MKHSYPRGGLTIIVFYFPTISTLFLFYRVFGTINDLIFSFPLSSHDFIDSVKRLGVRVSKTRKVTSGIYDNMTNEGGGAGWENLGENV